MKLWKKTQHYHDPMFMPPDLSDFQIAAHTTVRDGQVVAQIPADEKP